MEVRTRRYSEAIRLGTFEERLHYLMIGDQVGRPTFGSERHLNQTFYTSLEWKTVRREVLIRDNGCDLGMPGYEVGLRPLVHHINPMTVEDVLERRPWILDPEYLITVSHYTHNLIHYGFEQNLVPSGPRSPGDTNLW